MTQAIVHIKALEDQDFLRENVGVAEPTFSEPFRARARTPMAAAPHWAIRLATRERASSVR